MIQIMINLISFDYEIYLQFGHCSKTIKRKKKTLSELFIINNKYTHLVLSVAHFIPYNIENITAVDHPLTTQYQRTLHV